MSTDNSLKENIDLVLNRERILNRHSIFQLRFFVVNKEPTVQRRLWRCLEELKTRKEGLDALRMQIDETSDNIILAEIEIDRFKKHVEDRRPNPEDPENWNLEQKIHLRKLLRKKESLENGRIKLLVTKQEQEEEAKFFLEEFEKLEKLEKLKPFDDMQSQLEYWNERYAQMLNMKVLLRAPIDTELVSSVLSLPMESSVRKQVVSMLDNQHKQLSEKKPSSINGE